jgi:hypothetical protein
MSGAGCPPALETLVRRVAAEVRRRRAEHHAVRGLFWGALAGALVLLLRDALGGGAPAVAGGLVAAGALAGAGWGLLRRVPPVDAARLADRAWSLQDRVTTALEWAGRPDRPALVDALIADATARVAALAPRRVVPRLWPRETRWLPLPVLGVLVLWLAPPVPLPAGRMPDLSPAAEEEVREQADAGVLTEDRRAAPRTTPRVPSFEERDWLQRGVSGAAPTAGDRSAVFKDTSLATQRPDFNSFLKTGDERLRLLEQVDRLPDLQSDFTASPYRMIFRKSKALTAGLRPDQISPDKLRELLQEMERLGRKGGEGWQSEVAEGMEALEQGQQDRALEAMEKALNKLRAMEEAQRSGRSLRGGREGERGRRGERDGGRGSEGGGPDDQDFGEGEGLMPGKGKSPNPKGEATRRLQAQPYDVGVEGESRRGRKEAYDTNMTGRGGPMPSRLSYLGIIGQYRKAMEDALAREHVPRDYHGQIRDYFQSLDER